MNKRSASSHSFRKDAARLLWEQCFHDPEPFVDLYFDRVYTDEDTLIRFESADLPTADKAGKPDLTPIAQLQMIRRKLSVWGYNTPMGYISGACTSPAYRGRGLMSDLMHEAIRAMYQRGDLTSTLIPAEPWLFDYYRRVADYATAFYRREIKTDRIPDKALLCEAMGKCDLEICRSREDWEVIAQDLSLAGGGVIGIDDPLRCRIAYLPDTSTLRILSVEGDVDAITFCIQELAEKLATDRFVLRLPPLRQDKAKQQQTLLRDQQSDTTQHGSPHGMIRILNAPRLLKRYAATHPQVSATLGYTDESIPQNNGLYTIYNGEVTHCPTTQANAEDRHPWLDPATLADLLFASSPGYLNLMLD